MRRTGVAIGVVGTVVAATACIAVARAQPPAPQAYPDSFGSFLYSNDSPSRLLVACSPIARGKSGRERIECAFTQDAIMRPPSKAEVDAEVAKIEAKYRAEHFKDPASTWKVCELSAALADAGIADEELPPRELQAACAKKDLDALIRVATTPARRKGETCRLWIPNKWTATLERVDSETWVGTDGPRGLCNVTVTTTLSRKVDHGRAFWRLRQVRVTPQSKPGNPSCSNKAGVSTQDFAWDARRHWQADCRYLDL